MSLQKEYEELGVLEKQAETLKSSVLFDNRGAMSIKAAGHEQGSSSEVVDMATSSTSS